MQRLSVIGCKTASFQKCPRHGSVRVKTRLVGQIGSRVRVSASFQKHAHLVRRLGSGSRLVSQIGSEPHLAGRVGSEVGLQVSDSSHFKLCGRPCGRLFFTEIWRFNDFQNGGRPPSRILKIFSFCHLALVDMPF